MIIVNKYIDIDKYNIKKTFKYQGDGGIYKNAVFLDLEHYIYKVPICIGVFGACVYDETKKKIHLTQYMIESSDDSETIILNAYNYLKEYCESKKYIVTFSGNNDFGVIDYLFDKNNISFQPREKFIDIDLQREYEKVTKVGIGLKNLEKIFNICREGEIISGMTLAKIIKHLNENTSTLPRETLYEILKYNEADVVNLFKIMINWNQHIN